MMLTFPLGRRWPRSSLMFIGLVLMVAGTVSADDTCGRWQLLHPLPVAEDLNGVAWNGQLLVAVGSGGAVITSSDGIDWQPETRVTEHGLVDVAWGSGVFVAVGGGSLIVSDDGHSWTLLSGLVGEGRIAIAHGAPGFVVVGRSGSILSSADGREWAARLSPLDAHWFDVAWTGQGYVAVGSVGNIATSADGVQWQQQSVDTLLNISNVAAHGNTVIAYGVHNRLLVSDDDGHTWQVKPLYSLPLPDDIIWCADRFVSVGISGDHGFSTTTAPFWEDDYSPSESMSLRSAVCTGDGVVAVGGGGQIARGDGRHWWSLNSIESWPLGAVASDGSEIVVLGAWGSPMMAGPAGRLSLMAGLPAVVIATDVVWAGGQWVLVGRGRYRPTILNSSDGKSWAEVHMGAEYGPGWQAVVHDGRRFVVVDEYGGLGVSSDGVGWTIVERSYWGDVWWALPHGVASDGHRIVIVGDRGAIKIVEDGLDWISVASGTTEGLAAVVWGDEQFVAVGNNGVILTSFNGFQWIPRSSAFDGDLSDITWNGEKYIAVGEAGGSLVSDDGVDWSFEQTGVTIDLRAVTGLGHDAVAVGDNGAVLRYRPAGCDQLTADFAVLPIEPVAGAPVRLMDLTAGEPSNWWWDFGDGSSSMSAEPIHTYTAAGEYQVRLLVSKVGDQSQTQVTIAVTAVCGSAPAAPLIEVPEAVESGRGYEVSWESGDGQAAQIEESKDPAFLVSVKRGSASGGSANFYHSWLDGPTFYYRVRLGSMCSGSWYWSPWSNVVAAEVVPSLSSPGTFIQVIPTAVHASETQAEGWSTEVVVHNPGVEAARAAIYLMESGVTTGNVFSFKVEAGSSAVFSDAVALVAEGNRAGSLLVGSDIPLLVSSRTLRITDHGSIGQVVAGLTPERMLGERETGHLPRITSADGGPSLLGVANGGPGLAAVAMKVRNESGHELAATSQAVPGHESWVTDDVAGDLAIVEPVSVAFEAWGGDATLSVWTSLEDEASGDLAFLPAIKPAPEWTRQSGGRLEGNTTYGLWQAVGAGGGMYVAAGHDVSGRQPKPRRDGGRGAKSADGGRGILAGADPRPSRCGSDSQPRMLHGCSRRAAPASLQGCCRTPRPPGAAMVARRHGPVRRPITNHHRPTLGHGPGAALTQRAYHGLVYPTNHH